MTGHAYRSRDRKAQLERKAAKQHTYRERQRARRKPSAEDVARAALHIILGGGRSCDDALMWKWIERHLIPALVKQGFDETQAGLRIEDLVERYRGGWELRRKTHLGNHEGHDVA